MMKPIYILGIGCAVSLLPNMAFAQSVTLDPGFYNYSHVLSLGGQEMSADQSEYCVRADENTKSLDELVDSLSDGGKCKLSNVTMTESTGRADIACQDTGLGLDIAGRLDAKFGSDFLDMDAYAALGPLNLTIKSKARRQGECPANWKNPDE